jgi:hypothetical protein
LKDNKMEGVEEERARIEYVIARLLAALQDTSTQLDAWRTGQPVRSVGCN